ncbi:hypothetical protein H072_10757 [Dactylellina haptotyla CBS 200.50]|uniref:Uncharacterized protein n=1 Tax=Dactylellina haptotyla (strain CBS 200.50) TaxID=1284197 RepID=S7ZZA1_DACHA|nr:hypothetical protein H072_10757 [Dactylellina haptotyla CBS 200.50]
MADSSRRMPSSTPTASSNRSDSSSASAPSTAISTGVSIPSSRTNDNNKTNRSNPSQSGGSSISDPPKKPFTDSSYRSRYSDAGSLPRGYKKPVKRRSIFIEDLESELDPTVLPPSITRPDTTSGRSSRHTSSTGASVAPASNSIYPPPPPSVSRLPIYAINPSKSKESYIMQLPVQPFRLSVLLLLLVAWTTISLSVSAERDLDGLLMRVPGEEGIVERREGNTNPPSTPPLQ